MTNTESLDKILFEYQDRMIEHPPSDYKSSTSDWEMNIIVWMAKVRDQILDGTFSLSALEFIANSLEGKKPSLHSRRKLL